MKTDNKLWYLHHLRVHIQLVTSVCFLGRNVNHAITLPYEV